MRMFRLMAMEEAVRMIDRRHRCTSRRQITPGRTEQIRKGARGTQARKSAFRTAMSRRDAQVAVWAAHHNFPVSAYPDSQPLLLSRQAPRHPVTTNADKTRTSFASLHTYKIG